MSDATWYFADGDEERGPVTEAQIRTLIGTGNLKADDLVWREGMDDWTAAGDVPGLFGGTVPAPAVDAQLPTAKARQERRAVAPDAKEARPAAQRRESRALSRWTPTKPIEVFKYLAFLGQPLLLAGLLLVLGSRGCESVASRYAERLASRADVEEARFEAQWQRRLGLLELQRDALDVRSELNAAEQQHLKDLNAEIRELEEQQRVELEKRRANDWRDLMTSAREARAGVVMWNFWR
ncbi:MAG: GYF domain-containing protein, partial [Planctomycetes bacterium]|nr:GYF domain-containing protein [Planctomycetota bacterium]